MVYDASGNLDREAVLAEIRAAEAAAGGKRLTLQSFLAQSKVTQAELRKLFPNWRTAMRAAGCRLPGPHPVVETEELLADRGQTQAGPRAAIPRAPAPGPLPRGYVGEAVSALGSRAGPLPEFCGREEGVEGCGGAAAAGGNMQTSDEAKTQTGGAGSEGGEASVEARVRGGAQF